MKWLKIKLNIISLNVSGLGGADRRASAKDSYSREKADLMVLQETKLHSFGWKEALEVGGKRNRSFVHKEAVNSSGGILIAWDKEAIEVMDSRIDSFVVSIICKSVADPFSWTLLGVYGPNLSSLNHKLWEELESAAGVTGAMGDRWGF